MEGVDRSNGSRGIPHVMTERQSGMPLSGVSFLAWVAVAGVVLLSAAAMSGWRPVSEHRHSALQAALRGIGYRAYAVLDAADVSTKLEGWTTGDTTRLQGADLQGVNLRYARASSAFFANSDLRFADMQDARLLGADLQGADLRNASLSGAVMDSARLRGANLQHVNLARATLMHIDGWSDIGSVTGANLYSVRNPPDGFPSGPWRVGRCA